MRFTAVCLALLLSVAAAQGGQSDPVTPPVDPVTPPVEPIIDDNNSTEPIVPDDVTPNQHVNRTEIALEVVEGFLTGFVGIKMQDLDRCSTHLVKISQSFQELVMGILTGDVHMNLEGLDQVVNFLHQVKRIKKHCESVQAGFEHMIKNMHLSLSPVAFAEQILVNSIFHSVEIISETAYAVEGALDGGYWEAGEAAGRAWSIALFGETISLA